MLTATAHDMDNCQHNITLLQGPLPAQNNLPPRWAWHKYCLKCGHTLANGWTTTTYTKDTP